MSKKETTDLKIRIRAKKFKECTSEAEKQMWLALKAKSPQCDHCNKYFVTNYN